MDELRLSLLALFVILIGAIYIRERLRRTDDGANPAGEASHWRAEEASAAGREPGDAHANEARQSAAAASGGGAAGPRSSTVARAVGRAALSGDGRESSDHFGASAPGAFADDAPARGELRGDGDPTVPPAVAETLGDVGAVRSHARDVPLGDIDLLRIDPPDEPGAGEADGRRPQTQLELDIGAPPPGARDRGRRRKRGGAGRPAPAAAGSGQTDELIVVLHVMRQEAGPMPPDGVRAALANAGLALGDMQIFHHFGVGDRGGVPVFSVAKAVEPGTFDPADDNSFATPGLTLFMRLPGVQDGVVVLELMFAAAQSLARALDANVLDEGRSVLSAQALNHLRDQVNEFSRRQRLDHTT
ncbi:MAG: cell division protein ZipA C-terminal FtsZ-binding domain-containing protein [Pseudomonadota bacterium]